MSVSAPTATSLKTELGPNMNAPIYTGTDLPANYRGGAFVSEHGSWDRSPLNGYKVVFVPFSGGRPSGIAEDVVTGFLDANNEARGRPVGLAVDRTGALLIADDLGDTVWRVSSLGPATAAKPNP
jgi:glucose/arabinose dehydrogenase